MDRRTFIKLTAASSATAATGCAVPGTTLVRFVPDEDIMPGQAAFKPGVCTLCPAGCGLTVRVMDADADIVRDGQRGVKRILAAKKLDGRPEHPVNQGRLCVRGQAGVQVLYHPDRITQPLKRAGDRGSGRYEPIGWDAAIEEFARLLDGASGAGASAAASPGWAWLGRAAGSHRAALVSAFVQRLGGDGPLNFDVFGDDVLRRANGMSFGRFQQPSFDLARARYVLSLGADFLGTWNSPVAQNVGYGAMRQGRRGVRGILVQVEARMTQTGANADQWVPALPGTEGALALGLAHVLLKAGLPDFPAAADPKGPLTRAASWIAEWADGLPSYAPEAVATITGIDATHIERLALELADTRPAAVIVGGPPLAHTNGLFTALAVNALNALLGAVDQPGGLFFTPQPDLAGLMKVERPARPSGSLGAFVRDRLSGSGARPRLVVVDGLNPVYTAPPAWRLREALLEVPALVSVGAFLDETSALADLILPDHASLESWADAVPESGTASAAVSVAPPAVRPLHDTRSTVDLLLEVSGKLAKPIAWPWASYEELLTASLSTLPAASKDGDTWSEIQERGGWWGALPAAATRPPLPASAPAPARFAAPAFDGDPAEYPLHFLPCASPAFLDGSLAHLPWLQELPDPLTSAMWSSWLEINPATAASLGIVDGDVVRVTSAHGSVEAAAVISPGVAPDLVAMPAGQGHTTFTRVASGRGSNPLSILGPAVDADTGALSWAATRVKVERVSAADGRLVLFAGGMREHGAEDHPPHR